MYKEDFSIERRDRERAQTEKDYFQQQLADAQDVIATLTQEVFNSNLVLSGQQILSPAKNAHKMLVEFLWVLPS